MATSHRTTLILDEESRTAARQIAHRLDCSVSEAIRRAVLGYRDQIVAVSPDARARRRRALEELFDLFEGHDADAEIRSLKREDSGF
jgi:hypothetical protein